MNFLKFLRSLIGKSVQEKKAEETAEKISAILLKPSYNPGPLTGPLIKPTPRSWPPTPKRLPDKVFLLKRQSEQGKSTLGILYELLLDSPGARKQKKICLILEDVYRKIKVYGETRIPAGYYEIKFKPWGGKYTSYKKKFPELRHERGMLHITGISNFEDVLIHIGNDYTDTEGCLLTGNSSKILKDSHYVMGSKLAYKKAYPIIADKLEAGHRCFLKVEDEDGRI